MSELEPKQPNTGVARSADWTASVRNEPDSWDTFVVPMLWFVGTKAVIELILENWLPLYLSRSIAFFIAGLVVFRFRGPRLARYGFGKMDGLLSTDFGRRIVAASSVGCFAVVSLTRHYSVV